MGLAARANSKYRSPSISFADIKTDKIVRLIRTGDGSSSLISEEFGEPYHSLYGAVEESRHVFISAGLEELFKTEEDRVFLLECGFGTGLNAFLSYLFVLDHDKCTIEYTGLEAYPLSIRLIELLKYSEFLQQTQEKPAFLKMHKTFWDVPVPIGQRFIFQKKNLFFQDIKSENAYNLVFYDAFAPNAQPDLWEREMTDKLYTSMRPGGLLCTYCAKGSFKRALKSSGFEVESLPGPPGKREMTRARKID